MQLTLTFALVRCDCGAERQAGQPCPTCGCEPDEVDEDLERRRAIVRGVGERDSGREAEPLDLEIAFRTVGSWLDGFFAAYEATATGPVDEAALGLTQSLEELEILHERVLRAARLRPNHAVWATIDAVVAAYDDVRGEYLAALTAATLDEASEAAARGQAAIDSAAAALDRFNATADAWGRVDEADLADEYSDLLAAEAVAAVSEAGDMVALDRKGAQLFERMLMKVFARQGSAFSFT